MAFYESISKYYDFIFPYDPAQVKFIAQGLSKSASSAHLLEIGCGTGNLALGLAECVDQVTAMDLDAEMIRCARRKSSSSHRPVTFLQADMLKLQQTFAPDTFDALACFGNTLVHLRDDDQVRTFINGCRTILKPGGKFYVQIINYDRICDQKIDHLDTIANETIRFERDYDFKSETGKIGFRTILTVLAENRRIENEIDLLPIRKEKLTSRLSDAGFSEIQCFGNFLRHKWTHQSVPLIVECAKNPPVL